MLAQEVCLWCMTVAVLHLTDYLCLSLLLRPASQIASTKRMLSFACYHRRPSCKTTAPRSCCHKLLIPPPHPTRLQLPDNSGRGHADHQP